VDAKKFIKQLTTYYMGAGWETEVDFVILNQSHIHSIFNHLSSKKQTQQAIKKSPMALDEATQKVFSMLLSLTFLFQNKLVKAAIEHQQSKFSSDFDQKITFAKVKVVDERQNTNDTITTTKKKMVAQADELSTDAFSAGNNSSQGCGNLTTTTANNSSSSEDEEADDIELIKQTMKATITTANETTYED
jgi:hypothetical protein